MTSTPSRASSSETPLWTDATPPTSPATPATMPAIGQRPRRGEASGCTAETTEVFLESAFWDPITVATTGRALKINSDARYRFERGVDPAFTLDGLDVPAAQVLARGPAVLEAVGRAQQAGGLLSSNLLAAITRGHRHDLDRPRRSGPLHGGDRPHAACLESHGLTYDLNGNDGGHL